MIEKQDALLLLTLIEGDNNDNLMRVLNSKEVPVDIIKFINDKRPLDIVKFYEKLRKSYNAKKSKLYINLMKDYEENNINEIIDTLNSYALQASLFKDVEDKQMFLKNARLPEVYECLKEYSQSMNLKPCLEVCRYLKADIKFMEQAYREK